MNKRTRRDFLYLATGVAGAIGAGAVAWPFIDQLRPDEAILASSTLDIDVSAVERGMAIVVKWRGQPVVIRNRTVKEMEAAQSVAIKELIDPQAGNPNVASNAPATDFWRSAGEGKENWLIVVNICTHLGCIPIGQAGQYGGWFCPCHGSVYDTAGRVRNGPADRNLVIPPYRFLTGTMLRIG